MIVLNFFGHQETDMEDKWKGDFVLYVNDIDFIMNLTSFFIMCSVNHF